MTREVYFSNIIDLYRQARKPAFKGDSNIFRGRSASISSSLEDLTASFLDKVIHRKCRFYTDQPISFNGSVRYLDIVIKEADGTIKHLIDVKTDLGWKRNKMIEHCGKWDQLIERVKGHTVSFKRGVDKKMIKATLDKNLKLSIVIASLKNSGGKIKEDYQMINSKYSNINIYILSEGLHPNNYELEKEELLKEIKVRNDDFDRLISSLN